MVARGAGFCRAGFYAGFDGKHLTDLGGRLRQRLPRGEALRGGVLLPTAGRRLRTRRRAPKRASRSSSQTPSSQEKFATGGSLQFSACGVSQRAPGPSKNGSG
ncbi:unnamed protein product [Prorocentrum cordatum]|uniref:Uncharacterized protein n=1 Tax=Prorocentrum cordatum TaxID=2364126 RepID=A0ABN9X9I0_9DINO|nr:unnamed protein product [Polarella glacialis]